MNIYLNDEDIRNEFKKYDFDVITDDEGIEKIGNVIAIVRRASANHAVREIAKQINTLFTETIGDSASFRYQVSLMLLKLIEEIDNEKNIRN